MKGFLKGGAVWPHPCVHLPVVSGREGECDPHPTDFARAGTPQAAGTGDDHRQCDTGSAISSTIEATAQPGEAGEVPPASTTTRLGLPRAIIPARCRLGDNEMIVR